MGKQQQTKSSGACMDNSEIIDLVKKNVRFFMGDRWFKVEEIGDGNNNFVYRINDVIGRKGVIVKQALPYLRVAGESYKLTDLRSNREMHALVMFNEILPGSAPRVLYFDDAKKTIIMEDLSAMSIMRYEMMRMKIFADFPKAMGGMLASLAFMTSDLYLDSEQKKQNVAKYLNPELCTLVEKLVFTEPFYDAPDNKVGPEIRETVEGIWNDVLICREAARMKLVYLTKAQSFIHGDLHTGSIFVKEKECKMFDPEFAFYGPSGYDSGVLLANFLLNIASWDGRSDINPGEKSDYRDYILNLAVDTYSEFERRFREMYDDSAKPEFKNVKGLRDAYLCDIAKDTIGFAACEIIRRIIGLARVPDIESVRDAAGKAKAQKTALYMARSLFEHTDDRDVETLLKSFL